MNRHADMFHDEFALAAEKKVLFLIALAAAIVVLHGILYHVAL
jgi:hypothetical protein